jgi:hypothetical protein
MPRQLADVERFYPNRTTGISYGVWRAHSVRQGSIDMFAAKIRSSRVRRVKNDCRRADERPPVSSWPSLLHYHEIES